MKYVKIIILSTLLATGITAPAQENIEKELVRYKARIEQVIRAEMQSQLSVDQQVTGSMQLIVLPKCDFTGSPRQLLNDSSAPGKLVIDTSNYNAVFIKDQQVFGIAEKKRGLPVSFTTINDLSAEQEFPAWVNMVTKAAKYGTNQFMLNLLSDEQPQMKQLAFFNKQHLNLIDDSLVVYDHITALLIKRYGSIDKYVELKMLDLKKKEMLAKAGSLEIWKRIIQNDYVKWAQRFPADTTVIFELFVKEMDNIVALSAGQKQLLRQAVMSKVATCNKYNGEPGIRFLDRDIAPLVYGVLTQEQYASYIRQRSLNAWLVNAVSSRLDNYYVIEKHIRIDSLAKVYDSEVYSH
jgi:hypothetical protein